MLSVRTILLPTDGSAAAEAARPVARQLADRYGAALHALDVGVIPPLADLRHRPADAPPGIDAPPGTDPDGTLRVRRRFPTAADAILLYAEEADVDLVVMGTHGRSGLDRLTLGSTTERVLRLSPCPVLTVGPEAAADVSGPVLAPVVFDSDSDLALETAFALAESRGTRLIALHAIEPLDIPPPYGLAVMPFEPADVEDRVRETVAQWVAAASDGSVPVQAEARHGRAADVVLKAARSRGAGLIVQSSHGRRGLGRWLLGSVAEAVVRQAPCPTLTLRIDARPLTAQASERLPVPRTDWQGLFGALSERAGHAPHAVSVDVLSADASGLVVDGATLLGLVYDPQDDAVDVLTDAGGHRIAHPFAVRSTVGGWALDAARDAAAPGPWTLELVRRDGTRERVTVWARAPDAGS